MFVAVVFFLAGFWSSSFLLLAGSFMQDGIEDIVVQYGNVSVSCTCNTTTCNLRSLVFENSFVSSYTYLLTAFGNGLLFRFHEKRCEEKVRTFGRDQLGAARVPSATFVDRNPDSYFRLTVGRRTSFF